MFFVLLTFCAVSSSTSTAWKINSKWVSGWKKKNVHYVTLKFGCKSPLCGDKMSLKSLPNVRKPTSRILLCLWVPPGSAPRLTILWDRSELLSFSKWRTRWDKSEDMEATIKRRTRIFWSTIFWPFFCCKTSCSSHWSSCLLPEK